MSDLVISNEQLIKNLDEIALRVEKWPEWKKEARVVLGLGENVSKTNSNKSPDLDNASLSSFSNGTEMGGLNT